MTRVSRPGAVSALRLTKKSMVSALPMGLGIAESSCVRWLWLLALTGCFYLDPINVAPTVRIVRIGSGPVFPGHTLSLSAETEDDGGEPLVYDWRATAGGAELPSGSLPDFTVDVSGHDPVEVALRVTDEHGAWSEASFQLTVGDRAPDVILQVTTPPNPNGGYTVSRPIELAAMGSDADGDTQTYSFMLIAPPSSDPSEPRGAATSATTYRLVPDVHGTWEVAVIADDGYGMTATQRVSVTVGADAPPCIAATSPAWSPETRIIVPRAGGERRFSIESVSDDLDAYPGSGITFRWLVSLPGSPVPVELPGHDLPDFVLDPQALDPGDVLAVRVEVADRVTRELPCALDQAACSIGGDTCRQRLTWTVEVR